MKEVIIRKLRRHSTGGAVTFGDTADLCTETEDVDVATIRQQSGKHARLLVAGGMAGSIGKTFTAPLSRLTILFQVHSMVSASGKAPYSSSVSSGFIKVLRNEGLLAFWKGNGTSVIHRFPYSAVNFLAYESVKAELERDGETTPLMRFISGAIAGATATLSCYPLDLIRTRLATQLDAHIEYRGISHAFHRILTEEGISGLYRGVGPTLGVAVPNLAINFTIYETLKEHMLIYRSQQRQYEVEHLAVHETLLCGAIAGVISSTSTFPVDVVRRRMQLHGMYCAKSRQKRPSAFKLASSLFKEQGVRGFYRGLAPELLKVVPMVGITFGCFDRIKRMLQVD